MSAVRAAEPTPSGRSGPASFLPRWDVDEVDGAVVVIDVIRAFTTAACAFAAGADAIYLVGTVEEALAFKRRTVGALAVGEVGGRRPDSFDLPNSPVIVGRADLAGRTLVQRTSAGTQGVVAARSATRLWCASLVVASATARAVQASGLGAPTYVITGIRPDGPDVNVDDREAAGLIERMRLGQDPGIVATAERVRTSEEAGYTLALGDSHVDPGDIELACDVDRFPFAMEATRTDDGIRLLAVHPDGRPWPSARAVR